MYCSNSMAYAGGYHKEEDQRYNIAKLAIMQYSQIQIYEFKKAQCDPWMLHIPLPRVAEILAQSLLESFSTLSMEEQERIIVPLCLTAPYSSHHVISLLSKLSSDSTIWDTLSRLVEDGKSLSPEILRLMYTQRMPILQKHLIQCLQDLGSECIQDLKAKELDKYSKSEHLICDYLAHNCVNLFLNAKVPKYKLLPSLLNLSELLFTHAFTVLASFLRHCNYSIASIKVTKIFTRLIANEINFKVFPREFVELYTLTCGSPCIQCNDIVASVSDLNYLADDICNLLEKFDKEHIDGVRAILCMNCDWLVFCRSFTTVRSLFFNTQFL